METQKIRRKEVIFVPISQGVIQLRGDFGNPSGSGLAKIVVHDLPGNDTVATKAALGVFAAALTGGGFTDANAGDVSVVDKTLNFQAKPGSGVNIDNKLEVSWRTVTDDSIRSLTISGISPDSGVLEEADDGLRLTDAGKTALGGFLTTLYELTAGQEAIVLYGKYVTKY